MTTDQQIEQEIQAKGLTAPRVTPADIEASIKHQYFFTAADGVTFGNQPVASELSLLTFCVLVLKNGFTVTGESACASPENFDAEVGRKIARANAINKVWPLEGYLLKQMLHETTAKQRALEVVPVQTPGIRHRGTKDVLAWPMTRAEYNDYRGWTVPADEDGSDAGYLVEYLDGGKANHPHHDGYVSWSPADVFHRAYQPVPTNPIEPL